jgi:bifunctional DNase/RNase
MRQSVAARATLAILAAVLTATAAWAAESPTTAPNYEMEVMGIQADPQSGAPMVLLRRKEDKRELAMFIGPFEAQAIALPLQGMRPPRPFTHDLMLEVLHRLKAKVKRVVITGIRENTYFADLVLDVQGQEMLLDARPSDAIALALREDAPILAAEAAFARVPRSGAPATGQRGAP